MPTHSKFTSDKAIREDFLYYVWKTKTFDITDLQTTCGQRVQILQFGQHNTGDGPDFLHAHIRIGAHIWVGNVEMHVLSSHWYQHKHAEDPAYENVILHVVLEEDAPPIQMQGEVIPCLVLSERIPADLYKRYRRLIYNALWIPCERHIHKVDTMTRVSWLESVMAERLIQKASIFLPQVTASQGDWEALFYVAIARSFGQKLNAFAFESLAASLPVRIIQKHADQALQIEALLYGQAGFLHSKLQDRYPIALRSEYAYLKNLYGLKAIPANYWRFARLRPANFPTIRLAQFAAVLHATRGRFQHLIHDPNIADWADLQIHSYWSDHYVFDKLSPRLQKRMGRALLRSIVINGIIPSVFIYGRAHGDPAIADRVMHWMQGLKAEQNAVIREWKRLGLSVASAFDSQALIQLKRSYCDKKACMRCRWGHAIMTSRAAQ